jgi:hypothetical protein
VAEGSEHPGKPASGEVQPDGTFQLSTYQDADGALIGKHTVRYSPPVIADDTRMSPAQRALNNSQVPDGYSVEVKEGSNNFTIILEGPAVKPRAGKDG